MGILSRLFSGDESQDDANRAMQVPAVQAALMAAGRTEADLRELADRLQRSGVEQDMIPSALRNPDLVAWFFSLPDPQRISLDDSIRLINWARYGDPAGPTP